MIKNEMYKNLFLIGLFFWVFVVPVCAGIAIICYHSDWDGSKSSSGVHTVRVEADVLDDVSEYFKRVDVWLDTRGTQSYEALVELRKFTVRLRDSLPDGDPVRVQLDRILQQQDALLKDLESGVEFRRSLYRYKNSLEMLRRKRRYY